MTPRSRNGASPPLLPAITLLYRKRLLRKAVEIETTNISPTQNYTEWSANNTKSQRVCNTKNCRFLSHFSAKECICFWKKINVFLVNVIPETTRRLWPKPLENMPFEKWLIVLCVLTVWLIGCIHAVADINGGKQCFLFIFVVYQILIVKDIWSFAKKRGFAGFNLLVQWVSKGSPNKGCCILIKINNMWYFSMRIKYIYFGLMLEESECTVIINSTL